MKPKWFFLAILILLLGGGLVAFLKRESIRFSIETWRAESHMERALEARARGDVEEARRFAISSLKFRPGNIEALRLLLNTNDEKSAPGLLQFARLVFNHPKATLEDKAQCLDIILTVRDFRLFQNSFESLSEEDKLVGEMRLRNAKYLILRGAPDLALSVLEGPDGIDQEDDRHVLLRASLMSLGEDGAERRSGQEELAGMISGGDADLAARAFRVIPTIPANLLLPQLLRPAAESWIAGQDSPTIEDRLVLRTLEWAEAGDAGPAVARQTLIEFAEEHPLEIAEWLLAREMWSPAEQVARAAMENASSPGEVTRFFNVLLRSVSAQRRWEDLSQLLEKAPAGVSPMRIAVLKAMVAKQMGRKAEATSQWQEAWSLTKLEASMRNAYIELFYSARQAGEIELAADAIVEASRHPMGILPSTTDLTQMMIYLAENDRRDDLVAMTNNLFARESFSPVLVNNAVYLRQLIGKPVPGALQLIEKFEERFPDVVGFRTTEILLLVAEERYEDALGAAQALIEIVPVEELPASDLVVVAGAFRFAGQRNEAAEAGLEEKLASLAGLEKRFFGEWLSEG